MKTVKSRLYIYDEVIGGMRTMLRLSNEGVLIISQERLEGGFSTVYLGGDVAGKVLKAFTA